MTSKDSNPSTSQLRILVLGASNSGKLTLVKALTGGLPSIPESASSHAGLSHSHVIRTQYYETTIPIWIDEVPAGAKEIETWLQEYCGEEAAEVRDCLGAIIFTFREDDEVERVKNQIGALQKLVNKLGWNWGGSGDGVAFVMRMPAKAEAARDWSDIADAKEGGWEVLGFSDTDRDEYGETTGLERLKEGLEANNWGSIGPESNSILDGDLDDEEDELFGNPQMEKELRDLTMAILGEEPKSLDSANDGPINEEEEVERFEAMVMRLQGIKCKDITLYLANSILIFSK